jgi:membrane protease YdiL (CAAX protease family)
MKERLRQAAIVAALIGLVICLPLFILWCGPLFYIYNQEICEDIGIGNLWHLLLLGCGVVLCLARPRAMGLRVGQIRENLRLIGTVSLAACAFSALGTLLMPDHPFEDAPPGMYLATPVGEELIFRGFAYSLLLWAFPGRTTRWGISYAVLGSAILFGAWHVSMGGPTYGFAWVQAGYTTLAGVLLGLVRERTGSILPCIPAHMGSNYLVATL